MRLLETSDEVQMAEVSGSASHNQNVDRGESTLTRPQESRTATTSNTEVSESHSGDMSAPVTPQEHVSSPQITEGWKIEPDPTEAVKIFKQDILQKYSTGKPISLTIDLGDSAEDRERAILSFYKMAHVEWASPLICTLKGDPAIGDGVTRHIFATIMSKLQFGFDISFAPGGTLFFFEGEKDHLTLSTSRFLLESDFVVVAGRMIGGGCWINYFSMLSLEEPPNKSSTYDEA
uniref:Uncharacterized protein n=1 Tax=Knipowitschia caucasica TaxID=637954 RepID=A0AAV2JPI3_KNICA